MPDPRHLGLRVVDLERRVAQLEDALLAVGALASELARELKEANQP